MTIQEVRALKSYGHFSFSGKAKKQIRLNHQIVFNVLLDYLGISSKENNTCHLKGLLIMREDTGPPKIGTELSGMWWLSQKPTLGVVTDLINGYKCELSIVNEKGTIDRVYKYRLDEINPEETEISLDMFQFGAYTPLEVLNPHVIQLVFYRVLQAVLPYNLYDEVINFLPETQLNSIAKEALPSLL